MFHQQYFSKSLPIKSLICINYAARKIGKFKDWLGIGTTVDIKTSTAVIEILSYLAYETVQEVSNRLFSSFLLLYSIKIDNLVDSY